MKVCFIGLGYIGLPTAILVANNGIEVIGVDTNEKIVAQTNQGHLHIVEPDLEPMLNRALATGYLRAQINPEASDVFLIVVPTPFKENKEPDISYVEAATQSVIPFLRAGNLLIIESTSPVGTTEKMEKMIWQKRPELKGQVDIAYCPERVLPGDIINELIHNDRVIGGLTMQATQHAKSFYSLFVQGQLHATNSRTAEMCKLTENASRDVQIAFANELSLICDKAKINVWELIELANKHPRVNILQPGCGVGGHCIAVDPYFITSSFSSESRLIALSREINNHKAEWCLEKIKNAILKFELAEKRKPQVALMGLAFKPNIDDLRESPAVQIAKGLLADAHDANIVIVEPNLSKYQNAQLPNYEKAYNDADIVVFLTAHKEFKELQWRGNKKILDFCGIFKNKISL